MFDVGFWEILVIIILALIVIKPENLPSVARKLGSWFGKARQFSSDLKSDIKQQLDDEAQAKEDDK